MDKNDPSKELRAFWMEILRVDKFHNDDSFFSLGGTSRHVLYLLAKIKETSGIELSMRDVFENHTYSQLKKLLVARAIELEEGEI